MLIMQRHHAGQRLLELDDVVLLQQKPVQAG